MLIRTFEKDKIKRVVCGRQSQILKVHCLSPKLKKMFNAWDSLKLPASKPSEIKGLYIYSMTNTHQATSASAKPLRSIAAILVSGLCWYFSNGLNENFWYLLWVAPIPILLLAFRSSWKITFIASFIAYLIGRMSWFSFLATVATLVPAIIFSLLTALIFALIYLQPDLL